MCDTTRVICEYREHRSKLKNHNNWWKGCAKRRTRGRYCHYTSTWIRSLGFCPNRKCAEIVIQKIWNGRKNYWILMAPKNQVILNSICAQNKRCKSDFLPSFRHDIYAQNVQTIREHFVPFVVDGELNFRCHNSTILKQSRSSRLFSSTRQSKHCSGFRQRWISNLSRIPFNLVRKISFGTCERFCCIWTDAFL